MRSEATSCQLQRAANRPINLRISVAGPPSPRWLDSNRRAKTSGLVVLKASKRLDKFLITDSPKAPTPKRSRKTGTARKKTRKAENIGQARLLTPAGAEHIEALPIEPASAASISANDIPVDLGAAA
jgi:hypothetical protein